MGSEVVDPVGPGGIIGTHQFHSSCARESERVVWPFAMAFLDDMRLIAAWCEQRDDFRHFRADRVLDLEDTGRRYPQTRHQLLRRWEQLRLRRSEG